MRLINPDVKYENSYLQALAEVINDIHDTGLAVPQKNQTFRSFVDSLKDQSYGINLPEGYVPASTFWLIDNDEFIGRLQIRHTLNKNLLESGGHIGYFIRPSKRRLGYGKKILELGIKKAKQLGLGNILITCNVNNIGSKKIIESQNGKLENSYDPGNGSPKKLRYWINID